MKKWVEATIPMPKRTWKRLEKRATKEGCSVTALIKKAIIEKYSKKPTKKDVDWADLDIDDDVIDLLV